MMKDKTQNMSVNYVQNGLAPVADIGKLNLPVLTPGSPPPTPAITSTEELPNSGKTLQRVFVEKERNKTLSNSPGQITVNYVDNQLNQPANINELILPNPLPAMSPATLPKENTISCRIEFTPSGNGKKALENTKNVIVDFGDFIFERNNKVYYKKGDTPRMLLNFIVRLVNKISHKDIDGKITSYVEFEVCCDNKRDRVIIPESPRNKYFDNIRKKISKIFKGADISDRENKIDIYFSKIFELHDGTVPHVLETEYIGWEMYNGAMRYSHGGLDNVFSTKKVPSIIGQDMAGVFRNGINFLLAGKTEKLLPIFLFPALGITFKLFEDAGRYAPRFVLFIKGRTGSFKSELANLFFNVFETDSDAKNVDFNSTIAGLEHASRAANDSVLWVDDFRPPQTTKEKNDLKERLEFLVRRYGDKSAKARSAPDGKSLKKLTFRGCCGITGELIEGSHSSLLRIVQVELKPGDISSSSLSNYQKNETKLLFPLFYAGLISFLETNYDKVVNMIQNEFDALRNKYGDSFEDHRLTNSLICYLLMAKIILIYGIQTGALAKEQVSQIYQDWEKILFNIIDLNAIGSNLLNPQIMYLMAISQMLGDNTIKLAKSMNEFEYNRYGYIGYEDEKENKMYFIPKELYSKIKAYWEQLDQPLTLKSTEIHKLLKESSISIVSKGRHLYRSSTTGRSEMLCLDKTRFEEEVEKIRVESNN